MAYRKQVWSQLDDLDFLDDLALLSHSNSCWDVNQPTNQQTHSNTQMQDKTTCMESTSDNIMTKVMRMQHACNSPVIVANYLVNTVHIRGEGEG